MEEIAYYQEVIYWFNNLQSFIEKYKHLQSISEVIQMLSKYEELIQSIQKSFSPYQDELEEILKDKYDIKYVKEFLDVQKKYIDCSSIHWSDNLKKFITEHARNRNLEYLLPLINGLLKVSEEKKKEYISCFKDMFRFLPDYQSKLERIVTFHTTGMQEFLKSQNDYISQYACYYIRLEDLSKKCKADKNLKCVLLEVEKAFEECKKQYGILRFFQDKQHRFLDRAYAQNDPRGYLDKSTNYKKEKIDERFTQPIVMYSKVCSLYDRLITELHCNEEKIESLQNELKRFKVETSEETMDIDDYILKVLRYIRNCPLSDLQTICKLLADYYCAGNYFSKSSQKLTVIYFLKEGNVDLDNLRDETMGTMLVTGLERWKDYLEKAFQEELTWFRKVIQEREKTEKELGRALKEREQLNQEIQHKDEVLQSEAAARIKAEEDNAKLVEALKRAGIDPDSVLSGVTPANINSGLSSSDIPQGILSMTNPTFLYQFPTSIATTSSDYGSGFGSYQDPPAPGYKQQNVLSRGLSDLDEQNSSDTPQSTLDQVSSESCAGYLLDRK